MIFLLIINYNFKTILNVEIIFLQILKTPLHLTFNILAYILGYIGYFYMNMNNISIIIIIKEHKKHFI